MNVDIDKLLGNEETVSSGKQPKTKETVGKKKVKESVGKDKKVKESVGGAKKPKGKPRGGNSPVIGNNGLQLEPGDNTKYLSLNMEIMELPNIDLTDVEAVNGRLREYFEIYAKYDVKPTVSGLAVALNGHNRTWLWSLVTGQPQGGRGNCVNLPTDVTNSIKKAYVTLEMLWENYMQNGKVNPVAGIFLGKNNYGYQDKTEYVVTPNKREEDYSIEDIKARYSTPTGLLEESTGTPTDSETDQDD